MVFREGARSNTAASALSRCDLISGDPLLIVAHRSLFSFGTLPLHRMGFMAIFAIVAQIRACRSKPIVFGVPRKSASSHIIDLVLGLLTSVWSERVGALSDRCDTSGPFR